MADDQTDQGPEAEVGRSIGADPHRTREATAGNIEKDMQQDPLNNQKAGIYPQNHVGRHTSCSRF